MSRSFLPLFHAIDDVRYLSSSSNRITDRWQVAIVAELVVSEG